MRTLTITPPARPVVATKILIGAGILSDTSSCLQKGAYDGAVILYDRNLEGLAKSIGRTLNPRAFLPVVSGDASKSVAEVERIADLMLQNGCTRRTLCVCIGGGMITDLGGFIASVFMRGMPCVYIPTTMLAMVDAAIGGKTALNVMHHKNMLGTLTHPESVLIDIDLLEKLPPKQLSEGLTEAVKIAAICDENLFSWFEQHLKEVLNRDPRMLEECVSLCVSAKVSVVESDESDQKERLFLNFGHTVGHAVEAASLYQLSHGCAVSIGMAAEMQLSGFPDAPRVLSLLSGLNMPIAFPENSDKDVLWGIMKTDKKNSGGEVRIAVPGRIGSGKVMSITLQEFQSLFR